MQQDQRKKVIPFISRLVFYLKKKKELSWDLSFHFYVYVCGILFFFSFLGFGSLDLKSRLDFYCFIKERLKTLPFFFLKFLYVNDDCGNVCVGKT